MVWAIWEGREAARAVERRLLAAGFPAEDVHVIVPAERKGNVVARLRSPAPTGKPILVLAHLDVVEASPWDWSVHPFKFLERDGYFYGRGTTDDKDEAAIYTANMIRMKQEGYRPNRDIIMALTADEEGGTHNGVQYLLEHHRDLVDADVEELMNFWASPEGGFVFSDYGDDKAIGVGDPQIKRHMYQRFSEFSERVYGEPLPEPVAL